MPERRSRFARRSRRTGRRGRLELVGAGGPGGAELLHDHVCERAAAGARRGHEGAERLLVLLRHLLQGSIGGGSTLSQNEPPREGGGEICGAREGSAAVRGGAALRARPRSRWYASSSSEGASSASLSLPACMAVSTRRPSVIRPTGPCLSHVGLKKRAQLSALDARVRCDVNAKSPFGNARRLALACSPLGGSCCPGGTAPANLLLALLSLDLLALLARYGEDLVAQALGKKLRAEGGRRWGSQPSA